MKKDKFRHDARNQEEEQSRKSGFGRTCENPGGKRWKPGFGRLHENPDIREEQQDGRDVRDQDRK